MAHVVSHVTTVPYSGASSRLGCCHGNRFPRSGRSSKVSIGTPHFHRTRCALWIAGQSTSIAELPWVKPDARVTSYRSHGESGEYGCAIGRKRHLAVVRRFQTFSDRGASRYRAHGSLGLRWPLARRPTVVSSTTPRRHWSRMSQNEVDAIRSASISLSAQLRLQCSPFKVPRGRTIAVSRSKCSVTIRESPPTVPHLLICSNGRASLRECSSAPSSIASPNGLPSV